MISVVQNRNVYEIRFRYDPVLVDYVKAVPGRSWNAIQKYWTIPLDKLGFFINQIKGTNYEPLLKIQSDEHLNENATLDSTTSIPNVDISGVPIPGSLSKRSGGGPRYFQRLQPSTHGGLRRF